MKTICAQNYEGRSLLRPVFRPLSVNIGGVLELRPVSENLEGVRLSKHCFYSLTFLSSTTQIGTDELDRNTEV